MGTAEWDACSSPCCLQKKIADQALFLYERLSSGTPYGILYGSWEHFQQGSWKEWIEFFLNAVILRSKHNKDLLTAMNDLYEQSKSTFPAITGSANAVQILDYMFSKPLFTQPDLQKHVGTARTRQGFTNILHKLEQADIIAKAAPEKAEPPLYGDSQPSWSFFRKKIPVWLLAFIAAARSGTFQPDGQMGYGDMIPSSSPPFQRPKT